MDTYIISGKAYWASVIKPNTTYEPAWQVDVCLDEDGKNLVESLGLTVQNKGDENVKFSTFDYNYNNKKGVAAFLLAVQVVDLVPYGGGGSEFEPVKDGFVVGGGEAAQEVPF